MNNEISQVWIDVHVISEPSRRPFLHCVSLGGLSHLDLHTETVSAHVWLTRTSSFWLVRYNWWRVCSRRDYHQVDEQDPYLPPSAASQAIAARTLRGQGSYPPTAPSLYPNAHGTQNTIKQPLLLTPPPPSYATATARARQLHESMLKFVHEFLFCFIS